MRPLHGAFEELNAPVLQNLLGCNFEDRSVLLTFRARKGDDLNIVICMVDSKTMGRVGELVFFLHLLI
jgi:hypothetical protein